jgi:hypothetical protein
VLKTKAERFGARPFVFYLLPSKLPRFGEDLEAAVVGFFDIVGEAAAGQLSGRQMIAQTFATHSFSAAARI